MPTFVVAILFFVTYGNYVVHFHFKLADVVFVDTWQLVSEHCHQYIFAVLFTYQNGNCMFVCVCTGGKSIFVPSSISCHGVCHHTTT